MFNENATESLLSELMEIDTAAGELAAAAAFSCEASGIVPAAEKVSEALEKAVVSSRNYLEKLRPIMDIPKPGSPVLPSMNISGTVRIIEYNWLHIRLNTLLPHCRFQTPQYLSDTIKRLLDTYTRENGKLPFYNNALLIIDEHCDLKSRTVFDQDNKGWKAVPNALKGRVFPDDDQFSVGVALVSTCSEKPSCNIFIIDALEAGNFFDTRSSGALYW